MVNANKVLKFDPKLAGKNLGGDKEMIYAGSVVVLDGSKQIELLTARAWVGRSRNASRIHASVWLHAPGVAAAGYGWAQGYGYHKRSAAFDVALGAAGIKMEAPIDGRGDEAVRDAFLAIAKHLGYKHAMLVEHFGA